ncbi:MAG: nuclear transport factor 2 family protein [Saprospiraceae bacterium]
MTIKNSFLYIGLIAFMAIVSFSSCDEETPEPISEPTNTEKATAILQAIQSGDVTAMQDYISADTYIQHNLSYPDGASAVIGATESGAFNGTTINTVRSFSDGDYVILHSEYGGTWNNDTAQVAFDVFRFSNGLIVEHWDNLTNLQDDGDATSQLNGALTPASDLSETAANREVITNCSQDFFLDGKYSMLATYFDTTSYTQHSVGFGTDIQPLQGFLSTLPEGTPFYQSIEFIHVEGNFALMMSQGFPDQNTGLASAYFDLFRLENGKIVEHWDVVQAIPDQADWANSNGKW